MDHADHTAPLAVRAVVVDFDGTICPHDVSEELLEAFAPPHWREIDLQFQRGEIGSRECLVRQARLLRVPEEELLGFALERFAVDPSFPSLVEWTRGSGLTVAVASDGFGFYVAPMLAAAGVADLPIHANRVRIGRDGARFAFPESHPVCIGCGTCKMGIVHRYRETHGRVAFVGEGHSDRYGALYADMVFATKALADLCRTDGVPFLEWSTFDDVRRGLEATRVAPGRVDPQRCPGWTDPGRIAASSRPWA